MGTIRLAVVAAFLAASVGAAYGAVEILDCGVSLAQENAPDRFDVAPDIHVLDPKHQVDRRAPLAVVLGEPTTHTRLEFLQQRIGRNGGRLKIVLNRHDTRIYRSWIADEASHFTAEDHGIVLDFADWQDEHADVIAFGAVAEAATTLLGESPRYQEHLASTLDAALESFAAKVKRWRNGSDDDRRDAEALERLLTDLPKARWQIVQTFQLRNTWTAKIHFYRTYPELDHVFSIPIAGTIRRLADLDAVVEASDYNTPENDAANEAFENALRSEFTAFYSQHDHYALDRALVRAAWNEAQPRLLESSLVCPELLLDRQLFP